MSEENNSSTIESFDDGSIKEDIPSSEVAPLINTSEMTEDEGEVIKPIKTKKKPKSKARDSKARTASAAVFFNENRSIAGFGNSMRAVFTSVRELVENSLDASEKMGITPIIDIKLRRLDKKELIKLMGTSVVKSKDTRLDFLEISCKDNGIGVPRELIPQLFGTVLAGTKYGAQQTRGRFGLGSKMVLLYAMSTLDLPIQITTHPLDTDKTHRVKLFIDLEKNAPIIVSDEVFEEGQEEYFKDSGTEIKVSFTGSWNLAKQYVREYFRQLAIITPYADIRVQLPGDEAGTTDVLYFQRVVDDLPKPPQVVRIHPWGTDISSLRREISDADEENMVEFLSNNFMGVNPASAEAFFNEVNVDPMKKPSELTSPEIRRIVHDGFNRALKESKTKKRKRDRVFKFDDPKGDALSPLGANRLRKGLEKELEPDFVEALTRPPRAYEGHPFIIEAAIGYGGGVTKAASSKGVTVVDNRIIYRFANRIPLIFGAGSDLITNIANSINWSNYGLTRGTEPLAITVSLVSTKIPFPETSKEYIDKVEEIGIEVKLTLEQLGRKLKTFLGRTRRRQRERQRKSRFEKYAPQTVYNLLKILEKENLWNPTTGVNPSRIITALSSGTPRIDSSVLPPGNPIFRAPIWSKVTTQQKLQNNNIHEISTFLKTPNAELAKIMRIGAAKVDLIKRRTINELDLAGEIPPLDSSVILDPDIERRYHQRDETGKVTEFPRISKAFSRRWIRNAYDYLVSPPDKLAKVQSLTAKLLEAEKYNVIKNLFNTISETDLLTELSTFLGSGAFGEFDISMTDQDPITVFFEEGTKVEHVISDELSQVFDVKSGEIPTDRKLVIKLTEIIPTPEILYNFEPLKKRKVSSILEFLLEASHPSSPINEKVLAPLLIQNFKDKLLEIISKDVSFSEIKVDVSSQEWIDGYLRNAFKRRKISTMSDLINADDSVLIEIGELQRTLFSGLMNSFIPEGGVIQLKDYNSQNAEEKIKLLKSAGITSLELFANKSSLEMAGEKNYWDFVVLLIEESKHRIIEHLTLQNKLGSLTLMKEISVELENQLYDLGVSNTVDLLKKPLDKFESKIRKQVLDAKLKIGRNFDGFQKNHQEAFKKAGITVLDELVFNPDYFFEKELPETAVNDLIDALEYLMLPVVLIAPNLVSSINVLQDAGVTSVGKFLVWPSSELSRITDLTEEWINLIRESFSIEDLKSGIKTDLPSIESISYLFPEGYIDHLTSMGLNTIPQAAQVRWGDLFPKHNRLWSQIREIDGVLTGSLKNVSAAIIDKKKRPILTTIFNELENQEISTLLHFIKLPISSISQLIKGKRKQSLIEEFYHDLDKIEPTLIDKASIHYNAILTYKVLNSIRAPLVYLSEFNNRDIELLNTDGIKTINQLYHLDNKEIAKILGLSQKIVESKKTKSDLKSKGTPLAKIDDKNKNQSIISFEKDGITYFTSDEINSLLSSGYDTIESLYYLSDHRTFEVSGLNWEIINQFKKLLQSPPVLISWKKIVKEEIKEEIVEVSEKSLFDQNPISNKETLNEDVKEKDIPKFREVEYYDTFSSRELDKLTKSNITRVIDFITIPDKDLSKILGWDNELTKTRQSTIILQEAGISLSDLEIFRQLHLDHLNEIGLVTIEDLYFTAKEESWDSTILPWEPINTVKQIIQLHLGNAVEELGQDMVDVLIQNEIETILDLLLTGDPILEQKTGLPAERFENLKYALDFGELIQAFDKSVLFTPELNFFQIMKLRDAGYTRVLDLVLGDHESISKVLEVPTPYVSNLLEQINRTSIQKTEEERGVLIKDINAFSRSDLRSIGRSGIFEMNTMDTLQEVVHQLTPDIFQGEDYLLNSIIDLQKVCSIPLSYIGDMNVNEVKLMNKHRVYTIADALMIGYEDLETDYKVHTALTNITNSIMDLRPFLALGKLPSKAVMTSDGNDDPLIDNWLSNGKMLHQRTMASIRSLLAIPIRLTSFVKNYQGNIEELGDTTVADILLEYTPDEEHPNARIKEKLRKQGSIIKLLREGSTPITLLDLDPIAYRTLSENGINTMEKIMLNDEKILSGLTGQTQKFWKTIKDIFDPEVFEARLGDIGIPIDILSLTGKEKEELSEIGIKYLDQVTVFEETEGIMEKISKFTNGSSIFLAGSPGEREIAVNLGAINIIETILALRKHGADSELIAESISVGWQAYNFHRLDLPKTIKAKCNKLGIYSIQDLVTYIITSKDQKIPTKWSDVAVPFLESPLILPLSRSELHEIVKINRCTTIIEALTSPMTMGKINKIKKEVEAGAPIPLIPEIKLTPKIIRTLSPSTWKRFENSNFYLQEMVSSPRTVEEYKGIKQRYYQEIRNWLRTPLSRIHINGKQIMDDYPFKEDFMRLNDLIFDLPSLYSDYREYATEMIKTLESDNFNVVSEIMIDPELQKSAETSLGVPIQGFHDLWTATWHGSKLLSQIETSPAIALKNYVEESMKSIETINEITPVEKWNLIRSNIYTISDLLLSPEPVLVKKADFTKKRVLELQKLAINTLNSHPTDNSITLRNIFRNFGETFDYLPDISLYTFSQLKPHRLNEEIKQIVNVSKILSSPFMFTGIAENLEIGELKSILELNIYSVSEFLLYPESLKRLPKKLSTIEDRLNVLRTQLHSDQEDFPINELKLPEFLQEKFGHISKISELISYVLTSKDPETYRSLFLNMRYSGLDIELIEKFKENNVETIFDLLIYSPSKLANMIEKPTEWLIEFNKSLDFPEMLNKLNSTPLQIEKIEKISANGLKCLVSNNIHTLLDLNDTPPDGLNRADENYLKGIIQLLSAPNTLLTVYNGITVKELTQAIELDLLTVRSVMQNHDKFTLTLSKLLREFSVDDLLSLKDKQRKLSGLEDISVKEENLLLSNGIFTFEQLANLKVDRLNKIGLSIEKIDDLNNALNSNWESIIDLDQSAIEYAKESKIESVAELLSNPMLKFSIPIRVKREKRLNNLYDKLPPILAKKKIDTVSNLISSKVVLKEFERGNTEVIGIIAPLHSWIGNIPNISPRWVNKLEDANINRIWQYIQMDSNELAKICSSSVKAQNDLQSSINLSDINKSRSFEIPVGSSEDKELLQNHGIYSINDLTQNGWLDQFINVSSELKTILNRYKDVLSTEIWKVNSFWKLDDEKQLQIATMGNNLFDLIQQDDPNVSVMMLDALNQNLSELHPINTWINDEKVIEELSDMGINSLEAWLFSKTQGKIEPRHHSNTLFRSTLDIIDELGPKHIINAYRNGYTHISEILMSDPAVIAKSLGTNQAKVTSMLQNIVSLKMDRPKLPALGLVSPAILESLDNAGIYSWAQIVGNATKNEINSIKGITWNSILSLKEQTQVPLWYSLELRKLGVNNLVKLTSAGVKKIDSLLILGSKFGKLIGDQEKSHLILQSISRANLNKGKKHSDTKLSVSAKIKASDISKYNKVGILSPIDIILKSHSVGKTSPLNDGINDWERLTEFAIDSIEFPDKVIETLKSMSINQVKDAILMPDSVLREAGATNNQIKLFRKSLNRKKGWKPAKVPKKQVKKKAITPKKKPAKSKTKKVKKSITSKKKPVTKKGVKKKKTTKKKKSTKSRTKKASVKKS